MIARHGRVTTTIFLLACGLCAVGSMRAETQTVNPASESDGKCMTAVRPIGDALNGPEWNGWGVDSSQRRFQPATMALFTFMRRARRTSFWMSMGTSSPMALPALWPSIRSRPAAWRTRAIRWARWEAPVWRRWGRDPFRYSPALAEFQPRPRRTR